MRIYIYEEIQEDLKQSCNTLRISPTKLINGLFDIFNNVSHEEKAEIIDEIFSRSQQRKA